MGVVSTLKFRFQSKFPPKPPKIFSDFTHDDFVDERLKDRIDQAKYTWDRSIHANKA